MQLQRLVCRPPQDATHDITASVIAGIDAVGNGERQRADVIGNNAARRPKHETNFGVFRF